MTKSQNNSFRGRSQPLHFGGAKNIFWGGLTNQLKFFLVFYFHCFSNLNRSISDNLKVYAERKNLRTETKNASNRFVPMRVILSKLTKILSGSKMIERSKIPSNKQPQLDTTLFDFAVRRIIVFF